MWVFLQLFFFMLQEGDLNQLLALVLFSPGLYFITVIVLGIIIYSFIGDFEIHLVNH